MPMASSSTAGIPLAVIPRPSSSSLSLSSTDTAVASASASASKPHRPSSTTPVTTPATATATGDVIATLHLRTDNHLSATGSDVHVKVHIASTTIASLLHFIHRDCFPLFAKLPLSMILEDDMMRLTHVTRVPIPAGLYLPTHTIVDANVSRVAHLCMTVGSTFTLKLLHATRAGVVDAGDATSHTHLRTVLLTLVGLDRVDSTGGGIESDDGRLIKMLPSKTTVSSAAVVRSEIALTGIVKKGTNKNNTKKKNGKIKHQNTIMNSTKKSNAVLEVTPTPFGCSSNGFIPLDEDLNITADERYPNLSAMLFGGGMQHKETLILFHPSVGSLVQNEETRQVLQLAWAPEPFSSAGKALRALDQACAQRDRTVTFNWTARVVYSDCNSKRRVRRPSTVGSPVETFRFDGGDDDSEGVLETRLPQCGRAHDTGGWLVYDRGVLRACRGAKKMMKKKKNGGEEEALHVRESVLPLDADVQVIGSRRKRFRSVDELLMAAEQVWEQEI